MTKFTSTHLPVYIPHCISDCLVPSCFSPSFHTHTLIKNTHSSTLSACECHFCPSCDQHHDDSFNYTPSTIPMALINWLAAMQCDQTTPQSLCVFIHSPSHTHIHTLHTGTLVIFFFCATLSFSCHFSPQLYTRLLCYSFLKTSMMMMALCWGASQKSPCWSSSRELKKKLCFCFSSSSGIWYSTPDCWVFFILFQTCHCRLKNNMHHQLSIRWILLGRQQRF